MTKHLRSRDINSDLLVDKFSDPDSQIYIHKIKVAFGPDGEYTDVTLSSPFPVTGTFTPMPPGWQSFGQSTPKKVTVTDSSSVLLAANPDRLFARFTNNTSETIYIQYGIDAEWMSGVPVRTNGTLNITTADLFLGEVNAITDVGKTIQIDVIEGVST